MSIYIGNDLEDRLEALETENASFTLKGLGGGVILTLPQVFSG